MRKIFALTLVFCFLAALGGVSPASASSYTSPPVTQQQPARPPKPQQPPFKPTLRADRTEIIDGETIKLYFTYDEKNTDSIFLCSKGSGPFKDLRDARGAYALRINNSGNHTYYIRTSNKAGVSESNAVIVTVKKKPR